MFCAHCSEKILGDAVIEAGEYFCGSACASFAAGLDPEENHGYFEEDLSVDDFFRRTR